jgi:hypothetical protein
MVAVGRRLVAGAIVSSLAGSAFAACGENPNTWSGAYDCGKAAITSYPGTGQGMAMEAVGTTIDKKILNDEEDDK